jgi:hypothetical protein
MRFGRSPHSRLAADSAYRGPCPCSPSEWSPSPANLRKPANSLPTNLRGWVTLAGVVVNFTPSASPPARGVLANCVERPFPRTLGPSACCRRWRSCPDAAVRTKASRNGRRDRTSSHLLSAWPTFGRPEKSLRPTSYGMSKPALPRGRSARAVRTTSQICSCMVSSPSATGPRRPPWTKADSGRPATLRRYARLRQLAEQVRARGEPSSAPQWTQM